jgi:manganese transport protein
MGIYVTLFSALGIILFLQDPFQGLLWSQIILSIQLPLTIVPLILLTSSSRVMGKYANSLGNQILLWAVASVVLFLNVMLLIQIL